ncbi:copper chaperone PCu(A)C [Streptomyces ovatisporus]|uniref:Copper chaperone PCu(A)C n=1 Tax=Streptomyces ovatisporus TaxID=1128682 RepID=A0ABV9AA03_9ACTN
MSATLHPARGHRTGRSLRTAVLAGTAAVLLALSACGSGEESGAGAKGSGSDSAPRLTVEGAYLPEPVTSDMAGGFLVVRNDSATADKLTSVESSAFEEAQLHKTVDQQMQRVKSMDVPADGELRLSRGGNHIMFLKPERKPVKGEKVPVTLHFEKSDPVELSMPVKATNHVPEK